MPLIDPPSHYIVSSGAYLSRRHDRTSRLLDFSAFRLSLGRFNGDSLLTPALRALALALEELHGSLVLLSCGASRKGAEVSPATGSGIHFS
jgi:hypothetical protein